MHKRIFVLMLMPVLVLMALALPRSLHARQSEQGYAGVVVQFSDGTARTYCVAFTGDSISGLDLLAGTGLDVKVENYGGMGAMVCKIGPDGCDYPEQPCACQSYGPGGVYWSYHHLKGDRWVRSQVGASSYSVHNGDVDGWAWSDGSPPALYTFEQICGATAPRPPLPSPSSYPPLPPPPSPSPSPSPWPTALPPSPTPAQTARPGPTRTPRPALTPTVTSTVAFTAPATATTTATVTSIMMNTPMPTATLALTFTPIPTVTYTFPTAPGATTALPTIEGATGVRPEATVSVGRQSASSDREAQARGAALTIGAVALLGLVLWIVIRRRAR